MPLMYPVKHVYRNWKLFVALLIGIVLAATFFAAICVKANLSAEQAIDKQLDSILTDMDFSVQLNQTNFAYAYQNITDIHGVQKVDVVARIGSYPIRISTDNYTTTRWPQMVAFPDTSQINNEWLNKPADGIPENYTYLIADTDLAKKVSVGDNITAMIAFPQPKYFNQTIVYVNLTVAGFAEVTDDGYQLMSGYGGGYKSPVFVDGYGERSSIGWRADTMIISWNNTLMKLWNTTLDSSTVQFSFLVNVDRKELVNPWNMEASIAKVNIISQSIENQVLANYLAHGYVNNYLGNSLSMFQTSFSTTLLSFIVVSIPVFFVAWYIGSTVSDVSFNIRRREIGLLSTKGLSSGQIQRIFLSEALIIGLIGGALGAIAGLILNQYYAGTVDLNNLFGSQFYNPSIMVGTVVFGTVLAFVSVFWSSRQAAKMPAVDTLRNYMAPQPVKTWVKAIHWAAFILGTYKIVVFALGLNIQQLLYNYTYSQGGGNFIVAILQGPIIAFDAIMTYIAPFLFLWGLTKILIRDSTKFQTLATKISSVMGDLGALAAKNVRRNPARLAAMAFIIALILAFSVQVTGQIASQQDYTDRSLRANVGADVTLEVVNATKGPLILNDILANVSGVQNATIVLTIYAPQSGSYNQLTIRTIDPDNWTACAYYEQDWFSGITVEQAMREMKNNNNTIILDHSVAKQLGLNLHDEIGIDFASCPRKLKIIGFFGPEPQSTNGPIFITPSFGSSTSAYFFGSSYYSYVPRHLFNMTDATSPIYQLEDFTTTILIKLQPEANATDVVNQIRERQGFEVRNLNSFAHEKQLSDERNNLFTYGSLQILDIQGLGLLFAVLSASVGTALIAVVSLKERSREATLMSVRGLSYRQLVWMFLTESMAIITFAVIAGIVVGCIIVYGNITATNAAGYSMQLVKPRMLFPANTVTTIGTYVVLIYAATIGAILVMTSQYVTKLERMVRTK